MGIDLIKYQSELQRQVESGKLSAKTAAGYVSCMEKLCEQLNGAESCQAIAEAIKALGGGTEQIPKYISAVKKYERDVLDAPTSLLYGEALAELRRNKQKPIGRELSLDEDSYTHKINALRNKRLKLALRLQVDSGLRIFEIARLKPGDLEIDESGRIRITVREGKGGKSRSVTCTDKWLAAQLTEHISSISDDEILFYSESYLKKKAGEIGIKTHDLRRLNAKQRYRDEIEEGNGVRSATREVQHQLGHTRPGITGAYIGQG